MILYVKQRQFFPDPRQTLGDGLVAIGDDLDCDLLLEAYSFGIFPWPQEEDVPVLWFCPSQRGVIEFSELHISRSLSKQARKSSWDLRINSAFDQVIDRCAAAPRSDQDGTWITEQMAEAYKLFHKAGYAHSFECWDEDRLIGGLYGVYVGGVFSGESMFFLESNASKFCLWHMLQVLQKKGLEWIDVQMVTPNVQAFGGKYIRKSEFLDRVEREHLSAKLLTFSHDKKSVASLC